MQNLQYKSEILFSKNHRYLVGCWGVEQLVGLFPGYPMVNACKSFLFTEGSLKVENKGNLTDSTLLNT